MTEANDAHKDDNIKHAGGINALIKGMSPLVFVGCITLLIIPHFVSVSDSDPLSKIWDQLLNPMTMYVMPLFGMIVSAAIGLPTLRQFFASMIASILAITGVLAASYALGWPYNIVAMFTVIIPGSLWIFKLVNRRQFYANN